jgi:hypothetical protein
MFCPFPSSTDNVVKTGTGKERMSSIDFIETIIKNTPAKCEIFIIMDCCMSDGLNLPYILKKDVYRRNQRGNIRYGYSSSKKILLITSTLPHQVSIATTKGSIFTNTFCKNITLGKNSLKNLVQTIESETSQRYIQTPTIYVNNPTIKSIYDWMFTNHLFRADYNPIFGVVELERKEEE